MEWLSLSIVALVLYLLNSLAQWCLLTGKATRIPSSALSLTSIIVVLLHGFLLYKWIDVGTAQNLSFFTMFSMLAWLISVMILLTSWRKPMSGLVVFTFPLAAASILLVLIFPQIHLVETSKNLRGLFHILLSLMTLSVMCLAGLQSVLLSIQEKYLHDKQTTIFAHVPPLQTMERLLLQIVILGYVLLTVVIMTSTYHFFDMLTSALIIKTALVLVSWMIFSFVLLKHYLSGWRGRKMIVCVQVSVVLLLLGFFGAHNIISTMVLS